MQIGPVQGMSKRGPVSWLDYGNWYKLVRIISSRLSSTVLPLIGSPAALGGSTTGKSVQLGCGRAGPNPSGDADDMPDGVAVIGFDINTAGTGNSALAGLKAHIDDIGKHGDVAGRRNPFELQDPFAGCTNALTRSIAMALTGAARMYDVAAAVCMSTESELHRFCTTYGFTPSLLEVRHHGLGHKL